ARRTRADLSGRDRAGRRAATVSVCGRASTTVALLRRARGDRGEVSGGARPAYHEHEGGAGSDTLKFGGRRPPPPRGGGAIAGIAPAAAPCGLGVGRRGAARAATSSPSKSPSAATWPVPGSAAPATGAAARWPSAAGGCGTTAYLPQIHLAAHYAGVNATVLVGGAALQQVTVGP